MGLKQAFTNESTGLVVNDAYYRATDIVLRKGEYAMLNLQIYLNKEARDVGKGSIAGGTYKVEGDDFETYFSEEALKVDGVSILSNAYVYLKNLPEFSTAEDA